MEASRRSSTRDTRIAHDSQTRTIRDDPTPGPTGLRASLPSIRGRTLCGAPRQTQAAAQRCITSSVSAMSTDTRFRIRRRAPIAAVGVEFRAVFECNTLTPREENHDFMNLLRGISMHTCPFRSVRSFDAIRSKHRVFDHDSALMPPCSMVLRRHDVLPDVRPHAKALRRRAWATCGPISLRLGDRGATAIAASRVPPGMSAVVVVRELRDSMRRRRRKQQRLPMRREASRRSRR